MRDRYHLSYWVVPSSHHSSLPVVFETPYHRVLALKGSF
jgi:hypothetical protein